MMDNMAGNKIVLIVAAVIGIVVIVSLFPVLLDYINDAFLPTDNVDRYPIFGTAMGGLASLILGFWPVLAVVGLLAIGYMFWRNRS